MENLKIYNALKKVPNNAKTQIEAGRLKGKTNINPMWRIKALTEHFGPCGIGWKYEITSKNTVPGANDEVVAFVDINLYVKVDGVWSDPIPGTGGASFVAKERGGLYTSDECFKMALTDAISVSCKALGVAADVYWGNDATKYDAPPAPEKPGPRIPPNTDEPVYCEECKMRLPDYFDGEELVKASVISGRSFEKYGRVLCTKCSKKAVPK